MNSTNVPRQIAGAQIGCNPHAIRGGIRFLEIEQAGKMIASVRNCLASQRVEDFLEVLFAALSLVYFVAAVGFAGVLLGNAFCS